MSALGKEIWQRNWDLFMEIRRECGLEKPITDIDDEPKPQAKIQNLRDRKTGMLVQYAHTKPPIADMPDEYKARSGELRCRDWFKKEAARTGYSITTIRLKFYAGVYSDRLEVRKVHANLAYVKEKRKAPVRRQPSDPFNGKFAEGLI